MKILVSTLLGVAAFVPASQAVVRKAEPPKDVAQVSYSRDVAPIIATKCTRCHDGEDRTWWPFNNAKGLDMRNYDSLMDGGEDGPVIDPGRPESSTIVRRISSKVEGVAMPLFSPSLSSAEIRTISTWIAQGAKNDGLQEPVARLVVRGVKAAELGSIQCRPTAQGYYELVVSDPRSGSVLLTKLESANWQPGYGEDEPGRWINWRIGRKDGWPETVNVELRVRYASADPTGTIFVIPYDSSAGAMDASTFTPNPVAPPKDKIGKFSFWLAKPVDANLLVGSAVEANPKIVYSHLYADLGRGLNNISWNLADQHGQTVPFGSYAASIRLSAPGGGRRLEDIAILFQVKKPT